MRTGPIAQRLLQTIIQLRLDHRSFKVRKLRYRLKQGMVSEAEARMQMRKLQRFIDDHQLKGTLGLMRPPTKDELYPDGPPDITIAEAVESPGLRLGLGLSAVKHSLVVGATGAGKTCIFRQLITKTHDAQFRDATDSDS